MSAADALARFQSELVATLFRKDYAKHLDALVEPGPDGERARARLRVHRRMARTRLRDVVEHSFPRLRRVLGARFESVFEAWLDASPPRTPYLRSVPGELAEWLDAERVPGAPTWVPALARYEWCLLDVEYAQQEEGAADVHDAAELALDRPAVLTPAHRIFRAEWAVHRVPADVGAHEDARDLDALVAPGAFALCVYRDPTTHEPRVLELSPVAAAVLEAIAPGDRPVVDAVRDASARFAFAIDAAFVESFGALVADLVDRGVWLGSRAT